MKKIITPALNFYLMRVYFVNFLVLLFCLLGIVYLFDMVELLRRASGRDDLSLSFMMGLGLLKLPEVGQQLFPFVVLFSAMFTFWQLSKRSELVVLRSCGFSVWQFMAPLLISVLIIGTLQVSVINPMGAYSLKKFENLEDNFLQKKSTLVTISKQGLWLRQDHNGGLMILNADSIDLQSWQLQDVIVFFFDDKFKFKSRLDAQSAELQNGYWQFNEAVTNEQGTPPLKQATLSLPTELTVQDIEESFSDPEMIPFWALPRFAQTIEQAGFNATPLKVHFQKLLATPLLFLAMVFLAACVSLRPPREQGALILILAGIAMGFGVFFISNFLQALGASGQIPIFVAAWFPAIITFLLGLSVIMTLEDG